MQDRKLAFISADCVQEKTSPYAVQAGTVISAALITGIKSDPLVRSPELKVLGFMLSHRG